MSFSAGPFEQYTEAQEASAERLVRALVGWLPFAETAFRYGHAHFVPPSFKEDPGPLWLGEVLPRILGRVFPPQI